MAHNPTSSQTAIYNFIENGHGNGIIDAVAGAGKTTTLIECVSYIPNPQDAVYCAFNTSIQKEIKKKFLAANKNVNVSTIHALGYRILCAQRKCIVKDNKYKKIVDRPEFVENMTPEIDAILAFHEYPSIATLRQLDADRQALDWNERNILNEGRRYVRSIITNLLDINHKYRCTLGSNDFRCYKDIIAHFNIIPCPEREAPTYIQEVEQYQLLHQKLLKEGNSLAISDGIIDFTDQIYLPYAQNLAAPVQYGFIFVDECQDLSKAQVEVVRKYLRPDGRLLAVGDPYQAIYGFAGADCDSFERVKNAFNCTSLSLTDCFRCPQDVIKVAQTIRPDIKGFKKDKGLLYHIPSREVARNVEAGDLIICRFRHPLLELALKLINRDCKVHIHPDELDEFIGDYKNNFSAQELYYNLTPDTVEEFFENIKERNRRRIEHEITNVDPILQEMYVAEETNTMEATVEFLKQKYIDWHLNTVNLILKRLKLMLSCPDNDAVKISTIHRAKGLEEKRVFILEYEKMPCRRDEEWEQRQEINLKYVAVTRPKEALYFCDSQLASEGDAVDENAELARPINVEDVPQPAVRQTVTPERLIREEQQGENAKISEEESVARPATTYIPSFRIDPIGRMTRIPARYYAFAEQAETPYADLQQPCQKAKYWAVYQQLLETDITIADIRSLPFRDDYYFMTPNGMEIYTGYFQASGKYTFTPQGVYPNEQQIMAYLNNESDYAIHFEYNPVTTAFDALHRLIQASCQELCVCITNVYGEQNALVYCLKTSDSYASLKVYYNARNVITYVMPASTLGEDDRQLKTILENISHLWQQ